MFIIKTAKDCDCDLRPKLVLLLVNTIDSAELIVIISLNNMLLSFKSLLAFDSEI